MKKTLWLALVCFVLSPQIAAGAENDNITVCDCLGLRSEQDPRAAACKKLAETLTPDSLETESEQCEARDMEALLQHLAECKAFAQEFHHPLMGEKLERRITGMKDGKCHYVETMPAGGKMECNYPPEKLADIADYYKNSARFKNARIKSHTKFVDGKPVTKTRHFIDGVEVRNPLQESLDNDECQVTGYGKK